MRNFLLALSLTSTAAFAADNGSEFFHQAAKGAIELTPVVLYSDLKTSIASTASKNAGGSAEASGFSELLHAEYGWCEVLSTGLTLSNFNLVQKTDPAGTSVREDGFGDPVMFLKGRKALGPGVLHLGGTLAIAIDDHKIDIHGNSNGASGGMTVAPYAGYEMALGAHTFGAKISYDIYQSDRKFRADAVNGSVIETRVQDGQKLITTLFYEWSNADALTVGGKLAVNSRAKTKSRASNGITTENSDGSTDAIVGVYVPWQIAPTINVSPQFEYDTYLAYDSKEVSSRNGWTVSVSSRFEF